MIELFVAIFNDYNHLQSSTNYSLMFTASYVTQHSFFEDFSNLKTFFLLKDSQFSNRRQDSKKI